MKRRDFITRSALATASSMLIPNFLKAYELQHLNAPASTDKILVIIQFSGGNDGLNTLIPYCNDLYYKLRPSLAIEKSKVLTLNDELGLNPQMQGLKNLYDQGMLSLVNGVGYPNPDRSHFRSMDIWHTASAADQYLTTGWLGRYLDAQCQGSCLPYDVIELDDTLSLALKGEKVKGLTVQEPKKLYDSTRQIFVEKLSTTHTEEGHENVNYLYKTMSETISSAAYIYDKSKIHASKAPYPQHELGRKLKTVAEMIVAGLETNVYYVSISGFDTHVGQLAQQGQLLGQYAQALEVFVNDLKAQGKLDNTLVFTFSEFGRRVAQNASDGTDHGTANLVMLAGAKLKKAGVYNSIPSLTDLDEGDLKYQIDFRDLYASLLRDWLGADDTQVLGNHFDGIRLV
jgi:uncharacterized protein (DUF1501 family)